ncbi:cytochrome c [Rhizobiales bacterium GAS113]|nr:cytochrome c [Rhizobiales bacterium GAS113]
MFSSPELRRRLAVAVLAAAVLVPSLLASSMLATWAQAGETPHYGYGRTPTPAEIAGWDIDARGGDGVGLPPGKGNVTQGAEVFAEQCAACHGTFGEGEGRFPKLAGGEGTLTAERPEPTVGSYWPYAPTLFDYINRAMPMPAPHSLTSDQVYALTAYVLNLNNLVEGDFVADRDSVPKVKMPNRDHFVWKDPRPDTRSEACMQNCVDPKDVKIISSAEGSALTPRTTGTLDDMLAK